MKFIFTVFCAFTSFALFGQGVVTFDIGNGTSAQPKTVKVQGRGIGVTRDSALKDAYRDAIERAIGVYVDAEQIVQNDELVSDKILTHSNAYIEDYKIIKESTENNIITIRILASVKQDTLTRKLSDVMPKQTFMIGNELRNIHAKNSTTEKRAADAEALLSNVIKDINPVTHLIRMNLSDNKPLMVKMSDGKERLFYRFKFFVDTAKYYNEFIPSLTKVLDQIAVKKPRSVYLNAHKIPISENLYEHKDIAKYILGKWEHYMEVDSDGALERGQSEGVYANTVTFRTPGMKRKWAFTTNYDERGFLLDERNGNKERFYDSSVYVSDYTKKTRKKSYLDGDIFHAFVINKMNAGLTVVTAKDYALPAKCLNVVWDWQKQFCNSVNYNILFKDADENVIIAKSVSFKEHALLNIFLGDLSYYNGKGAWYVSPLIGGDSESFERWIGFDIPQDQLPNIKSISIEFAE